jgi:hypothetical protein
MTKKEVSLINTSGEILISLPEEEVQKLIVDLNIALDRSRMIDMKKIIGNRLTEEEREIIQRAEFLKNKGIVYNHI